MKKILFALPFLVSSIMAQDLSKSASDHLINNRWEEASTDYSNYFKLKENIKDSSAWFGWAYAKMQLKEYDDAIEYFAQSKELNYNPGFIYYNTGRIHALRNEKSKMLEILTEGANNGIRMLAVFQSDTAFNEYKEDEEYLALLTKVELNAYPCLSNENARHFDFWIGEWEVYVNDNKVGENSITMAKGGFAVHENYITPGNYAGQSINYYDPIDEKWHQHWVGAGGDVYNYIETKRGEALLQFESQFMNPANGQLSTSRLTFTLLEDGTVHQLFESSTDDGKTWSNAFDGIYKRKKKVMSK